MFCCPSGICYTPPIVIDWFSVIFNSFWIVGLALMLASLSYHYWEAQQRQTRFREQLSQPAFMKSFWSSIVLVSIGLAGTSDRLWEIALWIVFIMIAAGNFYRIATQN